MSVEVVVKKQALVVSGKMVKIGAKCRLPKDLAEAMQNKGLCEIVKAKVEKSPEIKTPKNEAPAKPHRKKRATRKKPAK